VLQRMRVRSNHQNIEACVFIGGWFHFQCSHLIRLLSV
jgi:hypothetical protein